jgi:hypothetical protein
MMTSLTSGRRKWYLAGGGAVLIMTVAATLGLTGQFKRADDPFGLPPELSAESLQARADDPQAMWQTMHDTMQRTDLTDKQREELMRRMRGIWQQRMDQHVDEYFSAPDGQKQAVLDRHIDEMQARMREHEAQHEREQAEGQHERRDRPHRPNFANMTAQERKNRSESRNPDRTARRMAYFSALRARMAERGIEMPHGPGGRGPGWRGGPRP